MMNKILPICLAGGLSSCATTTREKLASMTPQMPWEKAVVKTQETPNKTAKPQETVVLLHGLWRSKRAMNKMQDALVYDGYKVVNVGYPSNRKNLQELSKNVTEQISEHVAPEEKVSFVTHSLGGIVIRDLLDKSPQWQVQKVVMLAPPNHGSEIVKALSKLKLAWALGPVHRDLLSYSIANLPVNLPPETELGVIMGTDSRLRIFDNLLTGKNDGVVTVEGGKMADMKDFKTAYTNHTFIMLDDEVIQSTRSFLSKGTFATQSIK